MLLPHDLAGAGEPPLLLIPGANGHRLWMAPLAAALARRHRTVAITLPGEAEAPARGADPRRASLDETCAGALAVMDAHGLAHAVVVGTSFGGVVALRLALDHPGRVAGLVLHAATARPAVLLRRYRWALRHPLLAVLVFNARLLPALPAEIRAAAPGHAARRRLRRELLARRRRVPCAPGAFGWRLSLLGDVDLTGELSQVAVPALILSAAAGLDTLVGPDEGTWIARHLPGAVHQVVPGTGHLGPLLRPDLLAEKVTDFLRAAGLTSC